jgi:predicted enzyme related to lactoylglutathione lyase
MRIVVTSLFVEDQEKALEFYTDVLGFKKKHDEPAGEHRWISVVSPEEPEGTEIVLEPNVHPAAKHYQEKLMEDGIPATMFSVDNIDETYKNLTEKGVHFTMPPTKAGNIKLTVFDDTCGNLIQLVEQYPKSV